MDSKKNSDYGNQWGQTCLKCPLLAEGRQNKKKTARMCCKAVNDPKRTLVFIHLRALIALIYITAGSKTNAE